MICNHCGKELPDDALVCGECGAPVSSAEEDTEKDVPADAENAADTENTGNTENADKSDKSVNPENADPADPETSEDGSDAEKPVTPGLFGIMISNSFKILRGFFSRYTFPIVSAASKSKTPEGLLFAGLCALLFAFALPLNLSQYDALSDSAMIDFNFFGLFGMSLLSGIAIICAATASLFVLLNVVLRKNVKIVNAANAVGTSSIPLSCAFILDMLLGFWTPAALLTLAAAAMISFALLRHGFSCLCRENDNEYFFPFIIALTVTFGVALLFMYFTYSACVSVVFLSKDLFPV